MTRPHAYTGFARYSNGLTGHSGFNRRLDTVSAGAVCSSVQHSSHIRARQQLECHSLSHKPGYLQNFDLKHFGDKLHEMDEVLHYIRTDPFFEKNAAIAYRLCHYVGDALVVHGVIITDSNYQLLRRFDREDLRIGRNGQSASVLDFCLPYVSDQGQPAAHLGS